MVRASEGESAEQGGGGMQNSFGSNCVCTVPLLEGDDYDSFLQMLKDNPPSSESDAAASTPINVTEIAADHKGGEDENSSCESQTAGGSTGED